MMLQIVALVVLGLMCGSELNVAAFAHPTLNQQSLDGHIQMRSSLARLLGRVMPFWMMSSTVFNLLLLMPFSQLSRVAWRLAAIAFTIQVLAIVFSVLGPVPINNQVAKWTPQSLPADWSQQERRWDTYHWFRSCGLIVAFVLLAASLGARSSC